MSDVFRPLCCCCVYPNLAQKTLDWFCSNLLKTCIKDAREVILEIFEKYHSYFGKKSPFLISVNVYLSKTGLWTPYEGLTSQTVLEVQTTTQCNEHFDITTIENCLRGLSERMEAFLPNFFRTLTQPQPLVRVWRTVCQIMGIIVLIFWH